MHISLRQAQVCARLRQVSSGTWLRTLFFGFIVISITSLFYLLIFNVKLHADELFYYFTIKHIAQGQVTHEDFINESVLPGYVFILGSIMRSTGFITIDDMVNIRIIRLIMTIFSLFLIGLFYIISLFIFGFLSLVVFFIFNKGNIATGLQSYHPVSFHLGNIYFFLVVLFLLFFPYYINSIKDIIIFIKKHKKIVIIFAICLLQFFFFRVDHPRNQIYGAGSIFLRNYLMHLATGSIINKTLTYVILLWSLLFLAVTKFKQKEFYALYPFAFLSLGTEWLIEPR